MGARRKGRELALQMLYQWDLTDAPLAELERSVAELRNVAEPAQSFARELVAGTIRRAPDIDPLIERQSEKWKLERMAMVERNILRVAIYEFMEMETPKNVVINEALEIARRFAAPDAVSFINGILDAVCTNLQTSPESR